MDRQIEKIVFLQQIKAGLQSAEDLNLIDEILSDIKSPLKAYCRQEALYRYDQIFLLHDLDDFDSSIPQAELAYLNESSVAEDRFIDKLSQELFEDSEQWIDGEFLQKAAEKRVMDELGYEEQPKFHQEGFSEKNKEIHKTGPSKEPELC